MSGRPMERAEFTWSCPSHGTHAETGWTTATPGLVVYHVTPCGDPYEDPPEGDWWGVHCPAASADLTWKQGPEAAMAEAESAGDLGDWTKGWPW